MQKSPETLIRKQEMKEQLEISGVHGGIIILKRIRQIQDTVYHGRSRVTCLSIESSGQ